jgi:uncharacterized protein (DUF433 family)
MLQTEAPPVRLESTGALRVGKSRVLLELVIRAFKDGATPEAIVQQFPTAFLADIYAVIAYYLRHLDDIEEHLIEREELGSEVRQQVELRQLRRFAAVLVHMHAEDPSVIPHF